MKYMTNLLCNKSNSFDISYVCNLFKLEENPLNSKPKQVTTLSIEPCRGRYCLKTQAATPSLMQQSKNILQLISWFVSVVSTDVRTALDAPCFRVPASVRIP